MSDCSARHHSQYSYHATAYGFAGQIERPFKHIIPTQASTVLGTNGGRGQDRVEKFRVDGIVSFESAFVQVGGSFDECHNRHTSFASATIENLNILDVVTADRIVSRMAIYSPVHGDHKGEMSFNITGSHFDNLRIAGHKIDVKLATHIFHEHDTYSKTVNAHLGQKLDEWLVGGKLAALGDRELQQLENDYHALGGMSEVVKGWKQKGDKRNPEQLWFSPANHIKIQEHAGQNTELLGFGSIICVPKFGVIRLAELIVGKHCRNFTML